jgi:rubrerythrin
VRANETVWEYDEEYDYWQCKKCDLHWTMLDGTPEENGMKYCPKCGRAITKFKGWREE